MHTCIKKTSEKKIAGGGGRASSQRTDGGVEVQGRGRTATATSLGQVVTNAGDYAVFMVSAVIPGRPESIPLAERDSRKEELQNTAGQADYSAFVAELERRADIVISDDALAEPDL
jgi:hypothetical protein